MTSRKQQSLSVMMVVLVLFSGLGASVGTVSAQSAGGDAVAQCTDNIDVWGYIVPAYGAYQCIDGAFTPSDYGSDSELENEAYNNLISLQDTTETRQNGYNNWDELSQASALQQAEKPLIEAHYAGKSEGEARSAAQAEIRQYYSAQLSTEYNTHNTVMERLVSVGSATADDSGVTPMVYIDRQGNDGSGSFNVAHEMTANTYIDYRNVTLSNGNSLARTAIIRNLDDPSSNQSVMWVLYDGTELNNTTYNKGMYIDNTSGGYDKLDQSSSYNSYPAKITIRDPYSSTETTIDWVVGHNDRIDALNAEFNSSQGELVNMSGQLYNNYETGTVDPSEYVSAATLSQEYASEDGHYSYASALATTNGLRTDLQSAQTINYSGETYEGQILVSGQGQPLADDTGAAYFSSESDSVLNFSTVNNTSQATLSTATNVTVTGVGHASSDGVAISSDGTSVTVEEDAVSGEIVLFEINDDTGTNQTVVMYTSQTKADEGIPTGLRTGQSYSASEFQNGSVMMAYQQGDSAAVKTIDSGSFTVENATSASTGEQMDYIEYDDANQRTFNATNLRDELAQTERIQQAMEQREDISPAGSGGNGLDDWQLGALGALGGAGLVIAFGVLMLVLYLVGRITSVA
jgi:hypothetical protein